ncbi:hypothetical protein, variant [Cladophialophora immunda]|uniref:Uncharacterized protein n=1 Tax=Cladophialophora immunda TaxID=569365 RepID=A0A0D2CE02_9EURO|nr:uncharacterized protein PV07_12775 [Cladophialophora immunda]XP_016242016.1 hypothetical protein, variant [Cladophialophora immunda]KIW21799.1 hypothetical protein PV07_12775 [Cladophialophora immunda]KIW21800.1 hypothetical protein, variant [Cladophialophora immunda]
MIFGTSDHCGPGRYSRLFFIVLLEQLLVLRSEERTVSTRLLNCIVELGESSFDRAVKITDILFQFLAQQCDTLRSGRGSQHVIRRWRCYIHGLRPRISCLGEWWLDVIGPPGRIKRVEARLAPSGHDVSRCEGFVACPAVK